MSGNTSHSKTSYSNQATNTVNPYAGAKPLIDQGLSAAGAAFNSGAGQGVYGGERVPGSLSPQTQLGQQGLTNAANNFAGLGGPVSAKNLQNLASGGGNNPYFQQMLNNQLSNVGSMANNTAAAQGIGSSAQNQQLATTLGQTATQALSDQYNKNRELQLAANGMIDDQNQKWANTAAGLANNQVQSGLLNTALQQAQDQANLQQFNEQQMAPWKGIGLLSDAVNGLAGGYGTSTSTGSGTATGTGKMNGGLLQGLMSGASGIMSGLGMLGMGGII